MTTILSQSTPSIVGPLGQVKQSGLTKSKTNIQSLENIENKAIIDGQCPERIKKNFHILDYNGNLMCYT